LYNCGVPFTQICGRPRPVVPVVVAVAPGESEAKKSMRGAAGEQQPEEAAHYFYLLPARGQACCCVSPSTCRASRHRAVAHNASSPVVCLPQKIDAFRVTGFAALRALEAATVAPGTRAPELPAMQPWRPPKC